MNNFIHIKITFCDGLSFPTGIIQTHVQIFFNSPNIHFVFEFSEQFRHLIVFFIISLSIKKSKRSEILTKILIVNQN